jgi:hypothetical protein
MPSEEIMYHQQRSSDSMDTEETTTSQASVTRVRSFSHQVQSATSSRLMISPRNNHAYAPNINFHSPNFTNHDRRLDVEFNIEDHIKKTRKAAMYLKQVIHAQQCGGNCNSNQCRRIVQVLQHITNCIRGEHCLEPGCSTTKRLLNHCAECSHASPRSTSFILDDAPRSQANSVDSGIDSIRTQYLTSLLNNAVASAKTTTDGFCLLCSFARSDPKNLSPSHQFYPRSNNESITGNTCMELLEDDRFMPVISDEIIEFSKIPFQRPSAWQESHCSRFHTRNKTYSDSLYYESGEEQQQQQPKMAAPSMQPCKKMRSKSLNSVQEFSLLNVSFATTTTPLATTTYNY